MFSIFLFTFCFLSFRFFFFQAEDGIRDFCLSRGLGDVYKRQIVDCLFYGLMFNDPVPPLVASFVLGDGYAGLFYGRVVDMLYFPLFSFYWPDWIPWIGGERFEFFRPVFNIADSSISVGVVCMILFYHRYLSSENKQVEKSE